MTFLVRVTSRFLQFFLTTMLVILACVTSTEAEFATDQKKPVQTVVVIHCDYFPVSFWNKNTNMSSGFFVDIMDIVAVRAGLQVNYICKTGWSEMMTAIESGEADLGVLLKSEERSKRLLFSTPIDTTYLSFFARSQSSVDINSLPQGYTVGVVKGGMAHEQLKKQPEANLLAYDSYQHGLFALLSGEIQLLAGEESMILKRAREIHLEDRIMKVGKPFMERERGLAFRKDNVYLQELLNKALIGFTGSPEYQRIYVKWYGIPTPYWTTRRILIVSGLFLFIAVCGMAIWRYLSISNINKALILNIAERRKAEEELRCAVVTVSEEKAKSEAIIAAMGDAINIQDTNYCILYQNQVSKDIYGKHIGEYCYQAFQKNDNVCERCHLTMAFQDGMIHTLEQKRTTDEGLRNYEITASPVIDSTGKIIAGIEIVRDITERKKAEEALISSEQFIRKILDTVDEGFIVINRDFRIQTANNAYCIQVGEAYDSVIGRHCYELSHKTLRPCFEEGEQCAVRSVFDTGEPHTSLHRHPDAKGSILYVETKAFPIKDSSGFVTAVIETVNNITEKHLLEEEQLKSQKLEAIGILAGGIAHDFNNLLQGVFGYIYMANRSISQPEKISALLDQAEKALNQSVNLTNQLLTFSKGGKPLKKNIQLQPVIETAVKFALSGSRVDYRIHVDEELRMVDADEGQIGQVIQNLVLNAEQAMPMGGRVEISARNIHTHDQGLPHMLKQGDYVEISIKDSGIGIPEQYLSKIFDPYFTTKDKGSGLGLATSYSIIKNHGGLINVKSKLGKGTTFFVYLPAIESVETSEVTFTKDLQALRKGRILVMDDEDIIRDIATQMITLLGHEVELAVNGEEAIEKYRESVKRGRKFDIVILDLTVRGGMGGEEALRILLELDPDTKAVVSSGYAENGTMSEYEARGFRGCLTKPYSIDALNDTLNSLLR